MLKHIIAALLLSAPAYAQSQPQCAPHGEVVQWLADSYGEARVLGGISSNGTFIEFFANPTTGTWTALRTTPTGMSCKLEDGGAFTEFNDPLPPEGDPS